MLHFCRRHEAGAPGASATQRMEGRLALCFCGRQSRCRHFACTASCSRTHLWSFYNPNGRPRRVRPRKHAVGGCMCNLCISLRVKQEPPARVQAVLPPCSRLTKSGGSQGAPQPVGHSAPAPAAQSKSPRVSLSMMTFRSMASPRRCIVSTSRITCRRSKPMFVMSEMICSNGTARLVVRDAGGAALGGAERCGGGPPLPMGCGRPYPPLPPLCWLESGGTPG
eukprot:351140-Chlamydomonas_euryale.AAC.3